MRRTAALAFLVLAMVILIVVVDVLFLRHHVWVRLMVNVGIVLVFAAIYFALRGRR